MKKYVFLTLLLFANAGLCESLQQRLAVAAEGITKDSVRYDPKYYSIPYPMGDVPSNVGVCTDVVIRSYRKLGIDLQQLVHEDMKENFSLYPSKKLWGLAKADANIDHRRVQNLQVFFTRKGKALPVSHNASDYLPGDIVTWMVSGNLPHIGLISAQKTLLSGTPLIVHNIGYGQVMEDVLFSFPISGHYRYGSN